MLILLCALCAFAVNYLWIHCLQRPADSPRCYFLSALLINHTLFDPHASKLSFLCTKSLGNIWRDKSVMIKACLCVYNIYMYNNILSTQFYFDNFTKLSYKRLFQQDRKQQHIIYLDCSMNSHSNTNSCMATEAGTGGYARVSAMITISWSSTEWIPLIWFLGIIDQRPLDSIADLVRLQLRTFTVEFSIDLPQVVVFYSQGHI